MSELTAKLRRAANDPVYALRSTLRDVLRADERSLARLTGCSAGEVAGFLREPGRDRELRDHIQRCQRKVPVLDDAGAVPFGKGVKLQYALIRAARPEVVVETGVANGFSSAYILRALERNGRGRLCSIDIGQGEFVPAGEDVGWAVPDRLRPLWSLHIGDARDLLEPLLSEAGPVDVFIHDSLHTYEHMLFEYRTAYPRIRAGGFLLSDDALWNSAFPEFAGSLPGVEATILRGVGFLRVAAGARPSPGAEDGSRRSTGPE